MVTVASRARDPWAGAAEIVARIPGDVAAREMAAELESRMVAFEHLSEESRADVVAGLQRALRRWSRFVSTGAMPPDSDFDALREWTRARAAEGVRLEELLQSFGLAHQVGWLLLRRHARSDESEVLLELAAPLARYIDQISAVVTQTYLAERELLVSEEERRTRSLLDRLCVDSPLDAAERELADRLGVPVERAYAPFAVALSGRPSHAHAELAALAARLRRGGWRLAVTQGDCVVGLTWKPLELSDLGERPEVVLAIGEPTPRAELADAREEVTLLAEHARRVGLRRPAERRGPPARDPRSSARRGSPRACARGCWRRSPAMITAELAQHPAHAASPAVSIAPPRAPRSTSTATRSPTGSGGSRSSAGLDLGSPRDLACVYVALARDPSRRPREHPAIRGARPRSRVVRGVRPRPKWLCICTNASR